MKLYIVSFGYGGDARYQIVTNLDDTSTKSLELQARDRIAELFESGAIEVSVVEVAHGIYVL